MCVRERVCVCVHDGTAPLVRQNLLMTEVSRSQSHTSHSVGLLWTSDQPDAYTSLPDKTQYLQEISMSPAGFGPAIPASQRPQTQALDRRATGIRKCVCMCVCIYIYMYIYLFNYYLFQFLIHSKHSRVCIHCRHQSVISGSKEYVCKVQNFLILH